MRAKAGHFNQTPWVNGKPRQPAEPDPKPDPARHSSGARIPHPRQTPYPPPSAVVRSPVGWRACSRITSTLGSFQGPVTR